MPFSFPASPTVGQTSTQNGREYRYAGSNTWELVAASGGSGSLSGSVTIPASGDQYWDSTLLLMPLDVQAVDASRRGVVFTTAPGAFSTTKKFGLNSYNVNRQTGLTSTSKAIPDLSTGDWTVEAWVYRQTADDTYANIVFLNADSSVSSSSVGGLNLYINQNGAVTQNNGLAGSLNGGSVSVGTWTHVAAVMSSGVSKLYVNGTSVATGSQQPVAGPYWANIGYVQTSSPTFASDLLIDDLRITKAARYTANFTPSESPHATGAYTAPQTLPVTVTGSGGGSDSRWDLFLPPAPTSVTASAGNAQASVSWTAPSGVLSQAPITDYVVQFSSNSGSSWTTFSDGTSTATSATVTGLTNGTAHAFRVAAVNGVGQGAWSSTATTTPVSDAFASSVVTYLRMNGLNGSQTFTDVSPNPKTVTALNATAVTTSVKKYGTGSATNFAYGGIAIANGVPNFSGDFTVECWAYFNPCTSGCSGYPYKPDMCLFRTETTGGSQFMLIEGSASLLSVSPIGINLSLPSLSAWHHIAVVRQGTTIRVYVDGAEAVNSLNYGPQSINPSADNVMYVGGFGSWRWFDGYIDDFRVTNACRYPDGTTFTPPTE